MFNSLVIMMFKGIADLSFEIVSAFLAFLPQEEWRNFASTCKRFRMNVTVIILCQARVIPKVINSPESWRLRFSTLGSFSTLNREWRLGPLFQPVNQVTFSLPFDKDQRTRCLQLVVQFFRSLSPSIHHIHHIYLDLGVIWDTGKEPASIDYALLGSLLRELPRTGCENLSISSIDIHGQGNRAEPMSDILMNVQDEQARLVGLSIDSMAFSSPVLTPWFMRQVINKSAISYLKLSGTGFTAAQLDNILCYFDLPQLESLVIGDAWLASVVDLMQGCPRLHTVHFLKLSSDLRVPGGLLVSLPELHSIRGNATTLGHFIPLLIDVPWDSFLEVDMGTNVTEGPEETDVHILDVQSCVEIMKLLVVNGAQVESLAITFPPLVNFSKPLFEENVEISNIMQVCKVDRLRIQLHCKVEDDNTILMVRISCNIPRHIY